MEHYFKIFNDNIKRTSLRTQASEAALDNKRMSAEEKKQLTESYNLYHYRKYGVRVFPVIAAGGFVTYFKKTTRFFLGEILFITGITGFVLYTDTYNSNYFWKESGELVKKYTSYNDLTAVDDQKLDFLKAMYDKKKAQESLRKEYKVVNEKSDKMYDD